MSREGTGASLQKEASVLRPHFELSPLTPVPSGDSSLQQSLGILGDALDILLSSVYLVFGKRVWAHDNNNTLLWGTFSGTQSPTSITSGFIVCPKESLQHSVPICLCHLQKIHLFRAPTQAPKSWGCHQTFKLSSSRIDACTQVTRRAIILPEEPPRENIYHGEAHRFWGSIWHTSPLPGGLGQVIQPY